MYNRNALAAYICWKCQKGTGHHFQLYNVKLEQYNKTGQKIVVKTNDYICSDCKTKGFYLPDTKDSSKINLPQLTKEEYKKLVKAEQDALQQRRLELNKVVEAANPSPEPDIEQIKKEGNTTIQKVSAPA